MRTRFFDQGKPGLVPGFLLLAICAACAEAEPPAAGMAADMRVVGTLERDRIDEASGIAVSRRDPSILWLHNDSGARARLYAVDEAGNSRGRIRLEKADNDDWEDLAAFEADGEPQLLVADIGDNEAQRESVRLYVVADPDLSADDKPELEPLKRIDFRYPDGPRDAEAVAVDGDRALILSKRDLPPRLYSVPLTGGDEILTAEALTAVATLPRPSRRDVEFAPHTKDWHWQPTAMDIAVDGSAIVILTYAAVYYYSREPGEDVTAALARPPLALDLGALRNAEAIAFGADSRTLYLTIERRNAPLVRIDIGDTR